ncbi:nitrogen fixation protein NifU [Actinobaculum suis]|uniref:Nitrogen fixation protein NifU n=1 Tax=Actinobaculum suis TaxID=1657 RepID=A0A0K9ES03_9ACTO|nr:SUF system NifU family Fe-S cluster assembly protein [Actinobaculum suis]KMY22646.1 nitrogen fixation protein NifU [Actinobaculum suis]MDY5153032.1 SUF system NifU family Fe-S cluster assembly protein [Actinobaculum suis]SDE60661.1 nitrogen fixation protein NifU [Actinobaculum suis]
MGDLDELYQQIILDAARERHGEGELEAPEGESYQVNTLCGDKVNMQVKLSDDGETISDLAWQGDGCSISQASISIMNDLIAGQKVDRLAELYGLFRKMMDGRGKELPEAEADELEDATAFVGVAKFPMRIKCALLGWMAAREATEEALAAREATEEALAARAHHAEAPAQQN